MIAAVLAAAAVSAIPVDVKPLRGSRGYGTVTLYQSRSSAAALVDVRELPPGAAVRILVQAGTCAATSASFAALQPLVADRRGRVAGRSIVRFRNARVSLATLVAGPHAVSVVVDGKRALCGEL